MDNIVTIIPVLNEENNILTVISKLREHSLVNIIVAIDIKTTDRTAQILEKEQIPFIIGQKTGYDGTVSAGIAAISRFYPSAEYILFSDAGGKYSYDTIKLFMSEIEKGADLVIGSRVEQTKYMLWHQKLGTQMVLFPIKLIFGKQIADISPFRLIRRSIFDKLNMKGSKFRYPSEMLVKCLALNVKVVEVPVTSLKRIGTSKVSGSIKNSLKAGFDMFSSLQFVRYQHNEPS